MNTLRQATPYACAAALLAALLIAGLPQAAHAQPDCAHDDHLAHAAKTDASSTPAGVALVPPRPAAFDLRTKDARWRANFGKQLALSLRSRYAPIREQTLMNIIYLAGRHDDKRDFYPAASGLIRIYERDRNETHRHMALTALHALDHAPSMDYLLDRTTRQWEPSKRIQRHARLILSDHYKKRNAAGRKSKG